MADVSKALEAKSDQLNATDILGAEPVIRIRAVDVRGSEQPIWVYFDGDNNRPWKPSKGMLRILAAGWGRDSDGWIGKHVQLMFESSVIYAGKEVGGIRVKAMSDIPAAGMNCALTISKSKREPYHVPLLKVQSKIYPADKFDGLLPVMAKAMADGKMTLPQVVAQCQKTGQLTPEQLAQLEAAAPIEVSQDENEGEVY
jgi:hypothetical protein